MDKDYLKKREEEREALMHDLLKKVISPRSISTSGYPQYHVPMYKGVTGKVATCTPVDKSNYKKCIECKQRFKSRDAYSRHLRITQGEITRLYSRTSVIKANETDIQVLVDKAFKLKTPMKCYKTGCKQLFSTENAYMEHCVKVHGCKGNNKEEIQQEIQRRKTQSKNDRIEAGTFKTLKGRKRYSCFSSKCKEKYPTIELLIDHCSKEHNCSDIEEIERRRRQSKKDRVKMKRLQKFNNIL